MAHRKMLNPKTDMDFFFETGFEERVQQALGLNESTNKAFALLPSEGDSRMLVLLLCNVVFYRSQFIKIDYLIEERTGTTTDNLGNFPAEIERFCQKIWFHMHRNQDIVFDIASDNTGEYKKIIPMLLRFSDLVACSREMASFDLEYWNLGYRGALRALANFMQQKTGKERFMTLAKLLSETAKTLGMKQPYDQKSIRDTVKYRRTQEK